MQRSIEITEDTCAGRIDLSDAPQFQQHGFRAVSSFAVYELRQTVGGAEEQRAL